METTPDDNLLDSWDFDLPADRIAVRPAEIRSASRLLALDRAGGPPRHHRFAELPGLLRPGDLLVANDSRVMHARLRARRASGGAVELVVLQLGDGRDVAALARPARKLRAGDVLGFAGTEDVGGCVVTREAADGVVGLRFDRDVREVMARIGAPPLPPYVERPADDADRERYQTVYAGPLGSAAAPTAGLHFDAAVLDALRARGIGFATVTLHVGIGTFRPLRAEDVARGELHSERYDVPAATVDAIARVRADGGRVIAVGTTSARTLESATPVGARVPTPGEGVTRLFVRPPYAFRAVDGLVTNFHLPRSSLLMLVACLVGRERLLAAYAEAIAHGYRFYSYGDAMVVA